MALIVHTALSYHLVLSFELEAQSILFFIVEIFKLMQRLRESIMNSSPIFTHFDLLANLVQSLPASPGTTTGLFWSKSQILSVFNQK